MDFSYNYQNKIFKESYFKSSYLLTQKNLINLIFLSLFAAQARLFVLEKTTFK